MYFTRLTPNFLNWERPSGRDGKCKSNDSTTPLYEEINGFGWEEWLFAEYHIHSSDNEFVCKGFVQALNQQNNHINLIDRLYLYTKVCYNQNGIKPGTYYVGYIDNVTHIAPIGKQLNEVNLALNKVCLNFDNHDRMLDLALNTLFKVKDVHLNFGNVFNQPIQLLRGQYRFNLYDIVNHPNFLNQINNY